MYAPRDGYDTVRPSAGRAVDLSLHGASVTVSHNISARLFLIQGSNRIAVTAAAEVEVPLRSLDVSGTGDTDGVAVHEGASAALTGAARLVNSRTPARAATSAGGATGPVTPRPSPSAPPRRAATC
ncbi:hypothetical protein [Streptomyces antarcticus]|uniref:hypothetical protein n=1 Tax=Streptomyces antarcticus TaxID=2996458 RepID=UPI00226E4221|nr:MULTISPECIES: hypothetical protein [unclassified Streptomyces]MCY0943345.1 hypothetical protein [Streptomyces sp. H34-AA3]MCZ4082465.1 hypothetical protein [Streptomyces sp. H34-S5]